MTVLLPRAARQRLSAAAMPLRQAYCRWSRAWRYATRRWTHTDLFTIAYEIEQASGIHALESITVEDVVDAATERWLPHPDLAGLCRAAASRVACKWNSSGDITAAARDWALDLVSEWAEKDGIPLVERDVDEAV